MNNKKRTAAVASIIGIALAGYSERVDILKSELQAKELAVKRFVESFEKANIEYEVKTVKYKCPVNKMGTMWTELDGYVVTLSEDIQRQVDALDRQILHDVFLDYIDDERYSFAVAVLMMAETTDFRQAHGNSPWVPQDVMENEGELWIQGFSKDREFFLESYSRSFQRENENSIGLRKRPLYENFQRMNYKFSLLKESIPVSYTNELFSVTRCPAFMTYSSGAKKSLQHIYYMRRFLDRYPAFLFSDSRIYTSPPDFVNGEKMRQTDTRKFIDACRENVPAAKPHLPALMMGLFTVDGYAFNDESGVYTMNERGRMLMDFIVEFPIPENATRLQAVMGGGNKEEIEGMMKKHGTEAKWRELWAKPMNPTFEKHLSRPFNLERHLAESKISRLREDLESHRDIGRVNAAYIMKYYAAEEHIFDKGGGILNEYGKVVLDFIVEHPVPENAPRLHALMVGGNKNEIEAMMAEHGTREKWEELPKTLIDLEKYKENERIERVLAKIESFRKRISANDAEIQNLLSEARRMFRDWDLFKEENDICIINGCGIIVMDFIVEFPHPASVPHLQKFINGGNKDEIEGMMKKYGTEEKWKELLKNPAHPEFAKYPQD